MTELVLTAYDVVHYLSEALPALKAAIYRGNLAPAKDVLSVYDDTLYDEWELSQVLVETDYSWLFTPKSARPEEMDPESTLVGLTYPLILAYHHPEVFRMVIGGSRATAALPLLKDSGSESATTMTPVAELVQPGFKEGLRGMWEITGYLTPEATEKLRQSCVEALSASTPETARLLARLAEGLQIVTERGFGLVIERE